MRATNKKKLQNTDIKEITKYNISLQQFFLDCYLDTHIYVTNLLVVEKHSSDYNSCVNFITRNCA